MKQQQRNTNILRKKKKEKDWDLRTKTRISCTISKELDVRLRKYILKYSDVRDKSHAVERMCWNFLMNENLSLVKLEEAEVELARCQTKVNQIKRRKEMKNAIEY